MRRASQPAWRKAPLLGGAFLFFCAMVAGGWEATPAAAQTQPSKGSSAKSSTANRSTAKPQTRRRAPVRRARGQMAPTAERIKEIQSALAQSGHYPGAPSGKWDAETVEALKRFQQDRGLTGNGKLTARTLQALGLGSETAGASPPRKSVAANSGANQQ